MKNIKCPLCGSENIRDDKQQIFPGKNDYTCLDCESKREKMVLIRTRQTTDPQHESDNYRCPEWRQTNNCTFWYFPKVVFAKKDTDISSLIRLYKARGFLVHAASTEMPGKCRTICDYYDKDKPCPSKK